MIFPFFYAFFAFLRIFVAFLRFSSLFSSSPKGQGQTTAIYCKNGEFHSDPVCTDPVQNFPTLRAFPVFFSRIFFRKVPGTASFKAGHFLACKSECFASSFSPLRCRTFIRETCLKKCKLVVQKPLGRNPFYFGPGRFLHSQNLPQRFQNASDGKCARFPDLGSSVPIPPLVCFLRLS